MASLMVGALFAVGAALAPAALASGGVTISTSFENDPISLDTSDAVGYAISNTTGSSQVVYFTDTLPAGVTLDNPVAATNTPGSGTCTLSTPTAQPGDSSIAVQVSVPSGSGTICTISYSVVANTPSVSDIAGHDSYSNVRTDSGVTPNTASGSLVVLSDPTLSFTAPSNGSSFALGQLAYASFDCSPTDPLDVIDGFYGTDDEGNQIESGAPIDTLDPGTRTLEVECYSAAGGGFVSQTSSYTVGSYTLSAVRVRRKTDGVSFRTTIPAGKLVARLIYGRKVIGARSLSPTSGSTVAVALKPTKAGMRLLGALRARRVAVSLQVTFTPQAIGTGDQQITPAGATVVTRNVTLPISHRAVKHARRSRRIGTAKRVRTRRSA